MSNYDTLITRNSGYVSSAVQEKIANCVLGIIGCGIGSTVAEAATRMGFRKFVLMDGDQIELHNLNRQAFAHKDIGSNKAEALAARIREINPEAELTVHPHFLNSSNVKVIVKESDLIIDTIDFLDLEAILCLHDEVFKQKKTLISGMSAGMGAICTFIPPMDYHTTPFRDIFLVGDDDSNTSYINHFRQVIANMASQLDPEVQENLARVFPSMENEKPCPASQVSPGAYSLASVMLNVINRYFSDRPVITFPEAISLNLHNICEASVIHLKKK